MVKTLFDNSGDIRDIGLIPGSERSPGEGHSNTFQYSCLENPMDRGAWWATVHGIKKSRTGLKRLSTHAVLVVYTCQCPSPNPSILFSPLGIHLLLLYVCFSVSTLEPSVFVSVFFPHFIYLFFLEANYYTILYWFCHTLT